MSVPATSAGGTRRGASAILAVISNFSNGLLGASSIQGRVRAQAAAAPLRTHASALFFCSMGASRAAHIINFSNDLLQLGPRLAQRVLLRLRSGY